MDPACCRDGPGTEALRGRAVSEKAGWGGGACRNGWRAQPPALLTECALLTLLDQVGGGPGVAVGLGGVSGRGRGRREGLEAQAETWVGAAGLRLGPGVGGQPVGSGQTQGPKRVVCRDRGPPSPQDSGYSCGCCDRCKIRTCCCFCC